ncbi:hypothetical protein PISMIDRAFT_410173 [Pisolithus microcarpus 441]|uniref:Uncharacterized protein n=1 Tax=Pisolithus microcarpus 441 TaxID=765257 RepID=A0A0C9Z5R6_9AGAM|nr:hypothetical protein PISMIDRAFT_410173 [Pisolithus microcarpus 441]
MHTDSTLHCTGPPLNDIQTTYAIQDPAAVVEVALAVQLERLRAAEALAARDNVVVRLEDAYTSVRQKSAIISRLERELEILRRSSTPSSMNPSALQDIQCSDSCTDAEGQTDDEKSVNLERHVREMHPGILSSACRWPSESITRRFYTVIDYFSARYVPTRHPPGYESQHHPKLHVWVVILHIPHGCRTSLFLS